MSQAASAAEAAKSSGLSPMQEALLSRADAIFAAIGETVSKASDVAISAGQAVAKEIPDIAFQYIAFGRAYHTLWIVIALFGLFVCYKWFLQVGLWNSKNIEDQDSYTWGAPRIAMTIVGAVSGAFGLIAFFVHIKDTVLVWAAPKVWLILEIAELVRRVKG